MRLVLTLLVRDEEDIIRQNILYHLRMGVSFVIATDNRSVDRTPAILMEFQRKGLLHLIKEERDDYAQSIWVSRMAQLAKNRFHAEWVINCDADEFWWPKSGNLAETLRKVPEQCDILSAPRHNFLPRPTGKPRPWVDRMVVREVVSRNPLGQVLPPKLCHRGIPKIEIAQGNHAISSPDGLMTFPEKPIEIFHFPIRSYAQFERKIAVGGAAYQRNTDLPPVVGQTWRELHKQWDRGELPDYYRAQVWSDDRIQEAIVEGLLVRDTRLRDFFRAKGVR